jgi:hypothetical protein
MGVEVKDFWKSISTNVTAIGAGFNRVNGLHSHSACLPTVI